MGRLDKLFAALTTIWLAFFIWMNVLTGMWSQSMPVAIGVPVVLYAIFTLIRWAVR